MHNYCSSCENNRQKKGTTNSKIGDQVRQLRSTIMLILWQYNLYIIILPYRPENKLPLIQH